MNGNSPLDQAERFDGLDCPPGHEATRPHSDGIGIFRDSANARAEVFTVLEANPSGGDPVSARPIFGWFLFNMAHFLAQPEAKTLFAKA